MAAKIKAEFLEKRIAFGTSGNRLGKRSEQEIDELAIMALESKDQSLLKLFSVLPPLAELKKAKTDQQLKTLAPSVEKVKIKESETLGGKKDVGTHTEENNFHNSGLEK